MASKKAKVQFTKASNPASRTGLSAERISISLKGGIHPQVVALQNTFLSNSGRNYTAYDMELISDFYCDNAVKTTMTQKDTKILLNNQKSVEREFVDDREVSTH